MEEHIFIQSIQHVMNQPHLHFERLFYSGKFRAVRDISVAPIDASDQAQIIRMMDEDDGVSAVRRAKKTFGSLSSNATSNLANALTGASSTFASGGGIIKQGVMMGGGSGSKKKGQSEILKPLLETHGKISLIAAPIAART